jgi:hypothetical protein
MPNSKISALTSATTPLAGTETLPVVQSSATKQVSVANLTAGRAVSAASLALTTSPLPATSGGSGSSSVFTANGVAYASSTTTLVTGSGLTFDGTSLTATNTNAAVSATATTGSSRVNVQTNTRYWSFTSDSTNSGALRLNDETNGTTNFTLDASGNATLNLGSFNFAIASRGVNFTANTPAPGMTSQLFNWYEDGTWAPAQGGGLTVVGAFSSTGRYTRIGRQVSISGTVTGATSVAVAAAGIITTNLPFTVGTAGHGGATNAAVNASASVICTTTNVTSANAIAATGTITFSATYFV